MDVLSRRLAEGRLVVFVGAGVSMVAPTSLPSWLSVNRAVVDGLVTGAAPLLADARLLADRVLARQHASLLPSEYFAEVIVGAIGGDYFPVLSCLDSTAPNSVHRALAQLAAHGRVRALVTTNFDRAIEAAFEAEDVPLNVCFREDDLRYLAEHLSLLDVDDGPCRLVKVHGCASEPNTLVDTLSQRKRGLPAAVLTVVRHLLDSDYWLFLGFSGADLEADPGYLGLRAAADRGMGFMWLVRTGTKPLGAVRALKAAWGDRASIVEGELPDWLQQRLKLAVDDGSEIGETAEGIQADSGPAQASVTAIATEWGKELGAPSSSLVLAFLLEAAGETSALETLRILDEAWPPDEGPDSLLERHVLLLAHQAVLLRARGRMREAAASLDAAARLTVRMADGTLAAEIANQRGNLLRQVGRLAEAETVFRDALKIAPPFVRPYVLGDLAPVLTMLGREDEARESLRTAIAGLTVLGDEVHRAGELANLAALSPSDEANRLETEALAVFDRLGHETGRATLLLNLAKAAREAGHLDKSRARYEQARAIAARIGDRGLTSMTLHGLAVALDESGESEAALEGYQSALTEAAAAGHLMEMASILNNLGRLHRDRGEQNATAEVRARALGIYRSAGNLRGEADTLFAASVDGLALGNPTAAIQPAQEARVLYERLGDEQRTIEASTNQATALRDADRPREAKDIYSTLLESPRDSRWEHLVPSWLVGAGRCELTLGETDAAQHYFTEGLDLTADHVGLPAAAQLAEMIVRDASDATAGEAVSAAIMDELARSIGAASRRARGLAESGGTDAAARLLRSAAAAAQHVGMIGLVGVSWTNLGRVLEMANESSAAVEAFARGARAASQAEDLATARIAVEGAIRLLSGSGDTDRLAQAFEDMAQIEDACGDTLAAAEARAQAASAWLAPFGYQGGVTTPEAARERAAHARALLQVALPVLETGTSALLERAHYDADFIGEVLSR